MYGRAGCLQTILFVRTDIGDEKYGSEPVFLLLEAILIQGMKNKRGSFPLLWKWNGKTYFGSAHGASGILQTRARLQL